MLEIEKKLNICTEPNWTMLAPAERIVFLDIETTGFKASRSSLYLIGISDFRGDAWVLHQYFAETKGEEIQLLHALSEFLRKKKKGQDHLILVTYNGESFDLPFLKEVEREYAETGLLRETVSFDLYKEIKPFKKAAGLEDLKLKSVEKKCGIYRSDPYSGGDLIAVYEEYLRLGRIPEGGCEDNAVNKALKNRCLECLLEHNEEDIADMIPSMKILGYRYLHDGLFDFVSAKTVHIQNHRVLDLKFRLRECLPGGFYRETDDFVISASEEDPYLLEITSEIIHGELRFYYSDWRNYYYLPAEDMAVHKSVGEFVDRKNRTQAAASNCYTRTEGDFIAVPKNASKFTPFFYRSYKGKPYAGFREEDLAEEEKWREYAAALCAEELY